MTWYLCGDWREHPLTLLRLRDGGTDFACLTGITPYVVFGELAAAFPIPLVSMVEAARDQTLELGFVPGGS